jgi:hypothetical protein
MIGIIFGIALGFIIGFIIGLIYAAWRLDKYGIWLKTRNGETELHVRAPKNN